MGHKHPEETEESNTWQGGAGGGITTGKGKEEETAKITEEEGAWACKAKAPRDTQGTTSEPQLLSPAEACHLVSVLVCIHST